MLPLMSFLTIFVLAILCYHLTCASVKYLIQLHSDCFMHNNWVQTDNTPFVYSHAHFLSAKLLTCYIIALSLENLSLGFLITKHSNQSAQLQRIARTLQD